MKMQIPTNITREHVELAIEEINSTTTPERQKSRSYYLIHGDKKLPPKFVIQIANKFANGDKLSISSFNSIQADSYLKKLGYVIEHNEVSYFEEIEKFLEQAKTDNLRVDHYEKFFSGLRVSVSFGKGNQAKIPWIAFLDNNNTVQKGIYPVYLYYKELDLLILAYGVSETNTPNDSWNAGEDKLTIHEYFEKNNLGTPSRYGQSFVYNTYSVPEEITRESINSDLSELINIFKSKESYYKSSQRTAKPTIKYHENFNTALFQNALKSSGLNFSIELTGRFISSLLTKPFVILTGLSGSGKTKLAQAFAMWICVSGEQYKIVPVGADWSNREPLLGFPNSLERGSYVKPENGVLDLILRASKEENKDKPFFLILDEMNLSHVERYFADFLSVMESKESVMLHPGDKEWNGVPSRLDLPKNLFIIGTVNIDETTYMFSPKVLDRANVIEFRVTADEMKDYLSNYRVIDMTKLEGQGAPTAADFVALASNDYPTEEVSVEIIEALTAFFSELKKTGAEFGYRSASEILRYAAVVNKIEAGWKAEEIIDSAIMQKLLPKVHGSTRKLKPVLETLGGLCLKNEKEIGKILESKEEIHSETHEIKYPISLEKIKRMYDNLISNGFTSYAEA